MAIYPKNKIIDIFIKNNEDIRKYKILIFLILKVENLKNFFLLLMKLLANISSDRVSNLLLSKVLIFSFLDITFDS